MNEYFRNEVGTSTLSCPFVYAFRILFIYRANFHCVRSMISMLLFVSFVIVVVCVFCVCVHWHFSEVLLFACINWSLMCFHFSAKSKRSCENQIQSVQVVLRLLDTITNDNVVDANANKNPMLNVSHLPCCPSPIMRHPSTHPPNQLSTYTSNCSSTPECHFHQIYFEILMAWGNKHLVCIDGWHIFPRHCYC